MDEKPLFRPDDRIGICSRKLSSIPNLAAFLGAPVVKACLGRADKGRLAALASWGALGWGAMRARKMAHRKHIPFMAVADGFFRGLDYRRPSLQPYSLVVDHTGIYYDATRPSDLETMLNGQGWETSALLEEARIAIAAIKKLHLSKYNHAPDASPYLLTTPGLRTRILIIDQPVDDKKVLLGMGDSAAFIRMITRAREAHPGAALFLKTHPAVLGGMRRGYLANTPAAKGLNLITQDVSPISLLAQADEVYTVNSQMGFEALLMGKKVHCFGMPFYAGWGLTDDSLSSPRRNRSRTVEELFAAAFILYSRYANPITGEACSIHDIIRILGEQRLMHIEGRRYTGAYGFSRREFESVKPFLASGLGEAQLASSRESLEDIITDIEVKEGRLAVPESAVTVEIAKACTRHGISLVAVQKGLLPNMSSSSGLPLFSRPPSIILDERGLCNDASRPSQLEYLLEHGKVKEEDIARGRKLRSLLVDGKILFNSEFAGTSSSGEVPGILPNGLEAREIILVPGQDAPFPAIGSTNCSMAESAAPQNPQDMPSLLKAVRAVRPGAFILYLDTPGKTSFTAAQLPEADMILRDICPLDLFPVIDEVHTLSSLCGMDALVRGVDVYTHGAPFYAGWGLTEDRRTFARRSRTLTVNELLAGALVHYPCYYDWHTRMFCGPEEICRLHSLPPRPQRPFWQRLWLALRSLSR